MPATNGPALLRKPRRQSTSISTHSSSSSASSVDSFADQKHEMLLVPLAISSPAVKFSVLPVTPKKNNGVDSTNTRTRRTSISSAPTSFKKAMKKQIQRLDGVFLSKKSSSHTHSASVPVASVPDPDRDWAPKARRGRAEHPVSFLDQEPSPPRFALEFPPSLSSSSSIYTQSSTKSRHRSHSLTSRDHKPLHHIRPRNASCPDISKLVYIHPMSSPPQPRTVTPSVYVEPEIPDPFFVDDEGDNISDDDDEPVPVTRSVARSVPPSMSPEVLAAKPLPSPFITSPNLPNLNKELPPPATDLGPDESDDDTPELILHGTVVPTMFLPIPNSDPLTTLINKYIYPPEKRPARDISGEWQHSDYHTLVMTNSWRALARMARDRIIVCDPADVSLILDLWHLRLSSLARLRLFNQTAAECNNLFSVLNAIEPPEARTHLFENVLPFELEVMYTRLKYWAGDHMGYLDALSAVLARCKIKSRGDATSMWKERGARIVLTIASQLVEMKEYTAATRLLEPLCESNPALRSAVARIYLQVGNPVMAEAHFAKVAADPLTDERQKRMNTALLDAAKGEWESAEEALKEIIAKDDEDYAAVNNLSVALLSQGKLKEGIEVLESALKSSPSTVVVAEPFLFNLSTLYELRSMVGFEKKRQLLVEVAKWSGDGLKTSCLKMPAN